jgi:hypothetical protein
LTGTEGLFIWSGLARVIPKNGAGDTEGKSPLTESDTEGKPSEAKSTPDRADKE